MNRLLVVDDDAKTRVKVREYAASEGYMVTEAKDGLEAVRLCQRLDFEAIVMDIIMPNLDGFSACKAIRNKKKIPILILSGRGDEKGKLLGFKLGIDDFMVKPFSPKELMARLNVIVERNKPDGSLMQSAEFEGLSINFAGYDVLVDGLRVDLTLRECELLFYLVRHKNMVLTRKRLLEEVWGPEYCGENRTVDTHIKMLRKNLSQYRKFIVTLRGVGYKFEA